MLNISLSYDNAEQIHTLSEYLSTFCSSKNFKYKVSKYNSFESFINSPPKFLDILIIKIDSSSKEHIYNIYNKVKYLYKNCEVIFIPDLVDFMLNGFHLKDFRYILLPLKYCAFEDEFSLCTKDLSNLTESSNKYNKPSYFKSFFVNKKTPLIISGVPTSSILFIKYRCDCCVMYTLNDCIEVDSSINQLDKLLDSSIFFRCHDDYIINLKKISKITKESVIINTKVIPVSESKFKHLKDKLLVMLKIK